MFSGFAAAQTPKPRFKTLHEFAWGVVGFTDGFSPTGVVIGPGGVLYGVTRFGGGPLDKGSAYSLTPPATPGGSWTEVVYAFPGGDAGTDPYGVLVGRNGVLYGMTQLGGTSNLGTVFSLSPGPPGGPPANGNGPL